ncbi:unnamed protein product [Arctogadus glacialis]
MSRLTPALVLAQVHCPTLTKHRETHHKPLLHHNSLLDSVLPLPLAAVEPGDKRKTLGTSILIRKADCQLVRCIRGKEHDINKEVSEKTQLLGCRPTGWMAGPLAGPLCLTPLSKVEDALGLKKRQDWDSAVPMFQNP